MAEKRKARRARSGEELRRVVRSPLLVRGAEGAMEFLLGFVLAGGEIFGGFAPFGVGLAASRGSGMDGLLATVGASLGYLTLRGLTEGLRYAAACVLVFSVAFAFYDVKIYKKSWFMPLVSAGMTAITGFVYLSDSRWTAARAVFFITEVLLAGAGTCFYRVAFSPWGSKGEAELLDTRQAVSLLFLLGTVLISMGSLTFFGDLSMGRVLSAAVVMAMGHAGGLGYGAAAGVTLGLGMDLAAGEGGAFYAMAYGMAGLFTGAGWRQGRLFGAITFVVTNAVAVLWTWDADPRVSGLYEVFMASVLFLLIPQGWMKTLGVRLSREEDRTGTGKAAARVGQRLAATAGAFRQVRDSLRAAFPDWGINDADPAVVFDRAAERVCRRCALRGTCWEQDYVSTFNALNDALPAMLEKGKGEASDFPAWFPSRCLQFSSFLRAANEEVTALRYRRQYQSRLRESRGAVCRQYETLADILNEAAMELSAELVPDPVRERRLRRHLAGLGLEGETAVYYDSRGRLRAEVTGQGTQVLTTEKELRRLSEVMGLPLRVEEEKDRVVLVEAEPLMAMAGVAARRREGQVESGDMGTWFKREDGSMFVLLCDGMGSGQAAQKESGLAVRLLEDFLRSGMEPAAALRTVNSALALRNEETGAFTTVDLLRVDLYTGQGELCKLGAAPTYLRRQGTVSRVCGAALPAGLAEGGVGPDVTKLELKEGDWVVLVSDGVADGGEDGWLRELAAGFEGESPKDLARMIMEESEKRAGAADDRTVVAIGIRKRPGI